MNHDYSVDFCKELDSVTRDPDLYRPAPVDRYEPGDLLRYDLTPVAGEDTDRVAATLRIEKFVGGGFAGQVYRVRVEQIDEFTGQALKAGGTYALKILIPPSGFSRFFRNLLYGIGFQGPFQPQCNPAAARAGALWQKFIRRAAKLHFGDERTVNDVHATFVDPGVGSCGEISDWVEGRTWRLEVDEYLDVLKIWKRNPSIDVPMLGSPEFRAKRNFMHDFVRLLNELGAHEFARQYEWTTWKSQPNCLKRLDTDPDPSAGLCAVDFRAGLALLPFLPMSPGDILLIFKGLARGSLVQFDRGNLRKLESFVGAHEKEFSDLMPLLKRLRRAETIYRNSIPDITHNHVRLLYSGRLWSTMLRGAVTGWRVRGIIDEQGEKKLRGSSLRSILFTWIGIVPFLGTFVRKLWCHESWRRHYRGLFRPAYFSRALKAKMARGVASWHRAGRVDEQRGRKVAGSVLRFGYHLALTPLPVGLHRFLSDWPYAKERIDYLVARPVRLYFNAELREQWLRDMVAEGRRKQIISAEDAETIHSQIKEPFIQKYLKSLAVHVCTAPVTQVLSVALAVAYVLMHPEMPQAQAWAIGVGIIAFFQVAPISPGSLTRGLYVVYLVIRERNFKDYNIAVFLGFFKYVGYLAFPIQMTCRYPTLARFMAGYWATEAVHVVPVFGESGALLEHWVYDLFYNWPLTLRRRMRARMARRAALAPRYLHVPVCAAGAAGLLLGADFLYFRANAVMPAPGDMPLVLLAVSLAAGATVTLGAGGAALWKRIVAGIVCATFTAVLEVTLRVPLGGMAMEAGALAAPVIWRFFLFSILVTVGAIGTEILLPDPEVKQIVRSPSAA